MHRNKAKPPKVLDMPSARTSHLLLFIATIGPFFSAQSGYAQDADIGSYAKLLQTAMKTLEFGQDRGRPGIARSDTAAVARV